MAPPAPTPRQITIYSTTTLTTTLNAITKPLKATPNPTPTTMHLLTSFMPYVTIWVTLTQLVPAATLPSVPVSVPTSPQVTSVLSAVNSGSTGAALSSNLGSITGAASPATGLTAAANIIPGMTTDPQTLLNEVSQVTEIMQFVASLLQTFLSTGGNTIQGIPGIANVGAVVQGQLILALLALSKNLIPLS